MTGSYLYIGSVCMAPCRQNPYVNHNVNGSLYDMVAVVAVWEKNPFYQCANPSVMHEAVVISQPK